MSHLIVTALRVRAKVGCKDSERAHPQMLELHIRIDYDMQAAIANDDVAHAIDYKGVAARLRELLSSKEWHLIETLAHEAALCVRAMSDRISRVELGVKKDVIVDAESITAVVHV